MAGTATKRDLQAIEFIQENPVDVILADIKMPGMSGLELSKEIEKLYPSIRIVILIAAMTTLNTPEQQLETGFSVIC